MSSPQHPTGSGPQPWQNEPPQHPGQSAPQVGGQPQAYGSAPGPIGSGPGQAFASAPTPYGSAPGPYGSAPGPYGSAPGPYGSAPGPYGSAPTRYGSGPGPYGSAPGQFGQVPAPKQKSGPGLLGPLTLRDLFLLFAGLLAFIALFVPYRDFGFATTTVWHWNVADMGAFVFSILAILLIVAAVLVNKLGSGRVRIGSLSLDQFISVLSAMAFTYSFIDLLTSAIYWHVGAYLAFFAALIAFFAGVFTMIPFFASEFAGRENIEAHPKARPVSKRSLHPAPVANVPGGSPGAPGFAPYGSAPAGTGQPGFGGPGQGQPGFGGAGQGQPGPAGAGQPTAGQPDFGGQPGSDGFGQPNQFGQSQFAAPEQQAQQPNPYAPPQQAEHFASAAPAPSANSSAAPTEPADGPVHSTGEGQTYLGSRDSNAPQHSQSEPTQAFGVRGGRDQAFASSSASTDQSADVPAGAASGDRAESLTDSDDESHSGAAAAAAGVFGAGAAAAGGAGSQSDSERRRGRHAAPESDDADSAPSASTTETNAADPDGTATSASVTADQPSTVASPTESSDLVSKVNSKSSDTSAESSAAPAEGTERSAQQPMNDATADENADDANIRSTEATVVSTPAGEDIVDPSSADQTPSGQGSARTERTAAAESEEPTQYVPVADYRNRPEAATSMADRSGEDTVAQTAIDSEPVPADAGVQPEQAQNAGQEDRQDGGRPIVQAFWFAVPEPREAVDSTTGMPVFTIYPGDWYLSLEDNGSWFKVRDNDGTAEGILRNIEGIQRG